MPPPLPTELKALIIRYVVELNTLSSIALTCQQFRYFANTHRFAEVNFPTGNFFAGYVRSHAFVDLLLSTVWNPETSVASHIRHVTLSLGKGEMGVLGPHPALADGTYTTILTTLLVAGVGSAARGYSLKLTTNIRERTMQLGVQVARPPRYEPFDWSTLPNEFVAAVRDTCRKSRLTALHLDWFINVPTNIFSGLPPKQVLLEEVEFSTNSGDEQDFETVLDGHSPTVPALKTLYIMESNFMELTKAQANIFQNLRALTYDITTPGDLNSIFHMKNFCGRLENVSLRTYVTDFVAIATGFMDFDAMPNLQYMIISVRNPCVKVSNRLGSVSIPSRDRSEPCKPYIHPINITVLLMDGWTYTADTAERYLTGFITHLEPTIMKSFINAMAPSLPASLTVHIITILDPDADGHQFDREAYRKSSAMSVRDYFNGAGCMEDIEFKAVVSIQGDAVVL